MTNLVTRLRDISFNGLRLDEIGYQIIDEAADEIERLLLKVKRYGVHLEECARYGTDPQDNIRCTCVLSDEPEKP